MQPIALAVMLGALLLIVWPLALYPAMLLLLRTIRNGSSLPQPPEPAQWPDAAMIICALNEQNVIGRKLRNSLELDYPGKLKIIVVNDGSTDRTAEIVREYAGHVELIDQPKRRGKVTNLNEVVQSR